MKDDLNIDLLKRLCETPGVPGREERVRALIEEEVKDLFDEMYVDAMGSLICTRHPRPKGGSGKKSSKKKASSSKGDATRVMILSHMDEIVLLYPDGGSSLVLMHWTDGSTRDYSNNPVKSVVRLEDPKAAARRIREAGYSIIREPEPAPEVGGFIVGFAKDPDGYLVELLDARQS